MNAWEAKRIASAPMWREKILECRGSDLSVSEWCRREGISKKTFYRHERMILDMTVLLETSVGSMNEAQDVSKRGRKAEVGSSAVFAELPGYARAPGKAADVICTDNYRIEVYDGISEETLKTVLRVMRYAE